MLCMTKANMERTAQATSETCICRAVRPVPAVRWPEVAVLLYKPLSCHGPLYLRDHFLCHTPATIHSNIWAGFVLQRRLGEHQKLSRSMELPLSDLCGLNFNFLRACCKSCIFLQGFEGSIKKLCECAFEMFLPSLLSAWYKLFSSRCYLNCWQVS